MVRIKRLKQRQHWFQVAVEQVPVGWHKAYLGHQHKEFQLIFFYGSLSDNGLLFYSNDIVLWKEAEILLMEVVLVEVVAEIEEFILNNLA